VVMSSIVLSPLLLGVAGVCIVAYRDGVKATKKRLNPCKEKGV
jgi:hypothetical protein